MSGALRFQIELTLLVWMRASVWDGMLHAFIFDPELPESREAYQVIANFFQTEAQLEIETLQLAARRIEPNAHA